MIAMQKNIPEPSPSRTCTVLVVEDESLLRLTLVDFLEGSGFRVLEAASAAEAIREIKHHDDIDLVFSDVMMPGSMDGFALAKWVHDNYPGMPVLLASGYIGDAHIGQAVSGKCFFSKPYDLDAVAEKIHEEVAAPCVRHN